MNGLIALLGSGEYLSIMDDVDKFLISQARKDGRLPRVICLPTAAGREGKTSVDRWSRMGIEHFQRLDTEVEALPIIDKISANDPRWIPILENANLIYLSGGDPFYLFKTMNGSQAWQAAQTAWSQGAILAGCSAGAMILGEKIPDLWRAGFRSVRTFGLVPATYITPHFDAIPGIWKPVLDALCRNLKKTETLVGIDENTALVGRLGHEWQVMGQNRIHIVKRDGSRSYKKGDRVRWVDGKD